mgnify:FL=1
MKRSGNDNEHTDVTRSKSAKKRESVALQEMARQLVALSPSKLASLPDAFCQSIRDAQSISHGGARKRQIQYLGKVLRNDGASLVDEVTALLAQLDASSSEHNRYFHQLEQWRDQLISGNTKTFDDITQACSDIDRQQLRMLTRRARSEAEGDRPHGPHYRALFQFIKNAHPGS